jgi:hypothetical protein
MLVLLAWLAGVAAALLLVFTVGAQLQCAADLQCAREGERWWYTPLLFAVALGPGIAATTVRWRSRRRAV